MSKQINHTAVQLACFVWREDITLVSTRHFVTSPTGVGRVKVVSTLEAGRPKRQKELTQGCELRSALDDVASNTWQSLL